MYNTLNKVTPRINHFDYKKYHFYLYVYLNPFRKWDKSYSILGETVHFAFEPIYIGKATGDGYRHNQHIAEYLKNGSEQLADGQIHNEVKKRAFAEVEKNMNHATDPHLPRNWDEYQRDWVIILKGFQTAEELSNAENAFVKIIGNKRRGTGPLTNALLG